MSAPSMLPKMSEEIPASSASYQQQPRKLTALERNNLEWESHKDEVRRIYMEQDKTLKDTMQYFKQEHNFSWSERKWKEKMQEWGFEKNIPAKEMKFMATKAWKRELEDGKETIFCRNGTVVDRGKVEMFKKQKLNSENSFVIQSIPGTPQHISYKTPKPISSDDCHSRVSEEYSEVQKADLQKLAATVDEEPIPKDDHFPAQIMEPTPMLASSVGEMEVDSEDERSEASQYLEIPESSHVDEGHIVKGCLTRFDVILVSSALERLLNSCQVPHQLINTRRIMIALNDLDAIRPLCSALRMFLEGSAPLLGNRSNLKLFRLLLLVFACELKVYISGGSSQWLTFIFNDLFKVALDLWLPEAGVEDELVLHVPAPKDSFHLSIVTPLGGGGNIINSHRLLQARVTRLASGCSELGWFHEAEVLFIVLRTTLKTTPVLSLGITQIAVQYCLHLEREKRCGEILSILHDTYTNRSNPYGTDGKLKGTQLFPEDQPWHLLAMGNIMNRIPRPLNQHISSDKVNQLAALENLFDEERRRFECEESEDSGESVVTEDDEIDCESSNKFGVTYSESVITGISFNYSDLYR